MSRVIYFLMMTPWQVWDALFSPGPGPDALSGVRRSLSSKNSQKWRLVGTGMVGRGPLRSWEEWNQEKGKGKEEVEGLRTRLSVRSDGQRCLVCMPPSTHGKA